MSKQYNIVISGAQGYIGRELMELVNKHPYLQLKGIHCREGSAIQGLKNYSLKELIEDSAQIDILLLATPAQASMELVAALEKTDLFMIDLSGAFRLPEELYLEWYGLEHCAPNLIKETCYGLTPWVNTQANYRLIANPGCYAACALMSLIPILQANLIKTESIIIDAKSGVSGAGKQSNPELMFCEIANNFYPYKIGKHQHSPEIQKALEQFSGKKTKLRMTTSLLPLVRGIAMTIYTEVEAHLTSDEVLAAAVKDAYQTAYQHYPLIRYKELGKDSAVEDQAFLSIKNIAHTPFNHIGYLIKEGQLTLYSCIDNLLKGAASQAIETINAKYHLPLQTGLLNLKEAA